MNRNWIGYSTASQHHVTLIMIICTILKKKYACQILAGFGFFLAHDVTGPLYLQLLYSSAGLVFSPPSLPHGGTCPV